MLTSEMGLAPAATGNNVRRPLRHDVQTQSSFPALPAVPDWLRGFLRMNDVTQNVDLETAPPGTNPIFYGGIKDQHPPLSVTAVIPQSDSAQLVAAAAQNPSTLVIIQHPPPAAQLEFRENHPQYKCCGIHSAGKGAKFVAITEWVVNAMLLLAGVILASMRVIKAGTFAGLVVHCALMIAAAISLWFAVARYRPHFVVVYISVKIAQIIVLGLMLLFALVAFGLSVAMFFAFFSAVNDEGISDDTPPKQPTSFGTNGAKLSLTYSNPAADNVNMTTSNGTGGKLNPDGEADQMNYQQMMHAFTITAVVLGTVTLAFSIWFLIIAIKCRHFIRDYNFYNPHVTVAYADDRQRGVSQRQSAGGGGHTNPYGHHNTPLHSKVSEVDMEGRELLPSDLIDDEPEDPRLPG